MSSYTAEFLRLTLAHVLALVAPGPDFAVVLRQSLTHGRRAGILTALGIATGLTVHVTYSLFGVGILFHKAPSLFVAIKWTGAAYLAWLGIQSIRASWQPSHTHPKRTGVSFAGKGKGLAEADETWADEGDALSPDRSASLEGDCSRGRGASESAETRTSSEADSAAGRPAAPQTFPLKEGLGERSEGWFYRTGMFTNLLNPKVGLFFVAIFAALVSPRTPGGVRIIYGIWICVVTALWFVVVATVFTHEPVRRGFLRLGPWIDRVFGVVFIGFAVLLAAARLGEGVR